MVAQHHCPQCQELTLTFRADRRPDAGPSAVVVGAVCVKCGSFYEHTFDIEASQGYDASTMKFHAQPLPENPSIIRVTAPINGTNHTYAYEFDFEGGMNDENDGPVISWREDPDNFPPDWDGT